MDATLDESHPGLYSEAMLTGMVGWRAGRARLERVSRWLGVRPLVMNSLLAFALAVPFATWSLTVVLGSAHLPWSATMGVAVIAGHAALAYRRVSPRASFAVVSAACVLMAVVTDLFVILPSTVVFPRSMPIAPMVGAQRRQPASRSGWSGRLR